MFCCDDIKNKLKKKEKDFTCIHVNNDVTLLILFVL